MPKLLYRLSNSFRLFSKALGHAAVYFNGHNVQVYCDAESWNINNLNVFALYSIQNTQNQFTN